MALLSGKSLLVFSLGALGSFAGVWAFRQSEHSTVSADHPKVADAPSPEIPELPGNVLGIGEIRLPKAKTVKDLVTELDEDPGWKEGLNIIRWRLGYAKSLRLIHAILEEKRARIDSNAEVEATSWLAILLVAGKDDASLTALATTPSSFAVAGQVLDRLPDDSSALRFGEGLLSYLCAKDPQQAMAWLEELRKRRIGIEDPSDPEASFGPRDDAYLQLLRQWEAAGVRDLLARVLALKLSGSETEIFFRNWLYSLKDGQGDLIAENLQTEGLSPELRENGVSFLIGDHTLTAAEVLLKVDLPLEKRVSLEGRIMKSWSEKDPAAALPWLYEHYSQLKQEEPLGNVVSLWLRCSSSGLLEYVQKAKPGAERDELIQAIFAKLAYQHEAAMPSMDDKGKFVPGRDLSGPAYKAVEAKELAALVTDAAQRAEAEKNLSQIHPHGR